LGDLPGRSTANHHRGRWLRYGELPSPEAICAGGGGDRLSTHQRVPAFVGGTPKPAKGFRDRGKNVCWRAKAGVSAGGGGVARAVTFSPQASGPFSVFWSHCHGQGGAEGFWTKDQPVGRVPGSLLGGTGAGVHTKRQAVFFPGGGEHRGPSLRARYRPVGGPGDRWAGGEFLVPPPPPPLAAGG